MRFYDGIWGMHSRKYIFSVFIRTSFLTSCKVFFLPSAFFFFSCHLLFCILSKLANKFHHVRPFCLPNFLVIMLNYNIIHPLSFNIERFERQIFIVSIDFTSILLFFLLLFGVSRWKKMSRVCQNVGIQERSILD